MCRKNYNPTRKGGLGELQLTKYISSVFVFDFLLLCIQKFLLMLKASNADSNIMIFCVITYHIEASDTK